MGIQPFLAGNGRKVSDSPSWSIIRDNVKNRSKLAILFRNHAREHEFTNVGPGLQCLSRHAAHPHRPGVAAGRLIGAGRPTSRPLYHGFYNGRCRVDKRQASPPGRNRPVFPPLQPPCLPVSLAAESLWHGEVIYVELDLYGASAVPALAVFAEGGSVAGRSMRKNTLCAPGDLPDRFTMLARRCASASLTWVQRKSPQELPLAACAQLLSWMVCSWGFGPRGVDSVLHSRNL